MDLPVPFHGNHPSYSEFVSQGVKEVLESGKGIKGMVDLQNSMRNSVQEILNGGWDKLNNFYKAGGY
jgi:hypothetical protein